MVRGVSPTTDRRHNRTTIVAGASYSKGVLSECVLIQRVFPNCLRTVGEVTGSEISVTVMRRRGIPSNMTASTMTRVAKGALPVLLSVSTVTCGGGGRG